MILSHFFRRVKRFPCQGQCVPDILNLSKYLRLVIFERKPADDRPRFEFQALHQE